MKIREFMTQEVLRSKAEIHKRPKRRGGNVYGAGASGEGQANGCRHGRGVGAAEKVSEAFQRHHVRVSRKSKEGRQGAPLGLSPFSVSVPSVLSLLFLALILLSFRERGLTLSVRGARSETNPYLFCIHLSSYNTYQLSITDTRLSTVG